MVSDIKLVTEDGKEFILNPMIAHNIRECADEDKQGKCYIFDKEVGKAIVFNNSIEEVNRMLDRYRHNNIYKVNNLVNE